MDLAQQLEFEALSKQGAFNEAMERGDSDIQQFYNNAVVFVTGGSGFVGKLLVEKLFRSCNIKKLYMLMRSKKGKTVQQRLDDILNDPLYGTLFKYQPEFVNKITVVIGDLSHIGLGINDEDWNIITKEVNIIFHGAATINFVEPLREATLVNVRGTREVLALGKACKNLRSFIHISTAYAHATTSRVKTEVLEQFCKCPVPPAAMIQLAESLEEDRLNGITEKITNDWPNTYAFTKALAEETVRTMGGDLPICIVRPSIVICSYKEPVPGWIDMSSVFGPSGITLGSIMGVLHVVIAKQDIAIDIVPVDFVSNAAIAAGWETAVKHSVGENETKIYTVSSNRNYLLWGGLVSILNNKGRNIISPQAMWYCFVIHTTNKYINSLLSYLLHYLPGYLIDGVCLLLGKKPRFTKMYKTISKMTSVLSFYTKNDWIFIDSNTQKLFKRLSETDQIIYNFDISEIVWTDYIMIWCLGLRKYIVKDNLKDTEYGLKKQVLLKIVTYFMFAIFIYIFVKLFCSVLPGFSWFFF